MKKVAESSIEICRPRTLKSRINEDEGLIRAAESSCKGQKVRKDIKIRKYDLKTEI